MSVKIQLRWASHPNTLVSTLQNLLKKDSFLDVTVAAEGKFLRAHKIVLCACSPYFEELLSISEDKHPIILLQDVKYAQLEALLSYMYFGEVSVEHDQLESLLRVAESLQIHGLFSTGQGSAKRKHELNSSSGNCVELQAIIPRSSKNSRRKSVTNTDSSASTAKKRSCAIISNINGNPTAQVVQVIDAESFNVEENRPSTRERSSTATDITTKTDMDSHVNTTNRQKEIQIHALANRQSSDKESCRNGTENKSNDHSDDHESFHFDAISIPPNPTPPMFEDLYNSNDDSSKEDSLQSVSPSPDEDEKCDESPQTGNNSDKIFRCKCGKTYTSNKSLWRHRKFACEDKQIFSCQVCGKLFSRSDNLRRHAVVAHCMQ